MSSSNTVEYVDQVQPDCSQAVSDLHICRFSSSLHAAD